MDRAPAAPLHQAEVVISSVDNYILITFVHNLGDDQNGADVDQLNALIGDYGKFVRVDQYSGGSKNMERDVYLLSSNFFGLERMAEAILKVEWLDPDFLALVHSAQNEEASQLYGLYELRALG